MNISCNIIRDLLPLYAEDMVSEDSKKLVDDHLCGCDSCMKELGDLKKNRVVPLDADTNSLSRVKNSIRRRRVLTVLAVLLTISSIIVSVVSFVTVPIYLPYEKAIEGVELREDGTLVIDYSRAVMGRGGLESKNGNKIMFCQSTVYDYLRAKYRDKQLEGMNQVELDTYILNYYNIVKNHGRTEITEEERNRFFNIETLYCFRNELGNTITYPEPQLSEKVKQRMAGTFVPSDHDYKIVYLFRDGKGGSMVLDEGNQEPDWELAQNEWNHDLYAETFFTCIMLSAALWFWIRWKNPQKKELLYRFVFLFASIAFGILVASHGQFNYAGEWLSPGWGEPTAAVATNVLLAACTWRNLYVLNQQGKAI